MTFTGIPSQSRGVNTAAYKITVGNALNGDTSRNCNVLDPGDGSGVKLAVQQAYDSGLRTVVEVLEGTYTFTSASAFTTQGCNVRGVDRAKVTFVCPSETGKSQNVCTISDGDTVSGITFSMTTPTGTVDAGTTGYSAVNCLDGSTLEDFAVVFNGATAANATFICVGRYASESPNRITIRRGTFTMANRRDQCPIYLASSSATQAVPGTCTIEDITITGSGTAPSADSTGIQVQGVANVRRVSCQGFPKAVRLAASYIAGAETLPQCEIVDVTDDVNGLTRQSPIEVAIISAVNSLLPNFTIRNVRRLSDATAVGANVSAYGLQISLTGVTAPNLTVDGFAFRSTLTTKGFVRISSASDAVIDRASLVNVKTPGTVQCVVANPSVVPFTNLVFNGVNANIIDVNNYANDTSIGAGSAGSITIGNGALRTCIGAEMQCATITNNGTGTLVAPRTSVSTAAVTANDDVTKGIRPGDYWLQTVGPVLSVCSNNTATAAVWTAI